MKCIYCGTDNTYKERAAKHTCKRCARPFAFEPKEMPTFPLTDHAFIGAINAVSEKGTLFFTPRQLYYQVVRQRVRPGKATARVGQRGVYLFWVAGIIIFILSLLSGGATGIVLGLLGGGGIVALGYLLRSLLVSKSGAALTRAPDVPITYDDFRTSLLARWERAHGPPPKMLPEGGRPRNGVREGAPETDIASYSFDRILVCDRAETADMLVANNLHFETNTPIVSMDGYPRDAFARVMEMTRRNPALTVFALHNADSRGCLLPLHLREDAAWFPQPSVTIIDIGLRPRHVAVMPGLMVTRVSAHAISGALARLLSPGERRWLAGGIASNWPSSGPPG